MALDTRTNVDKEINEGILRTYLGIDDPTGIDFGTYKTLLREKIAAARMGSSDMDSSDISYLTNEFLRIKNIEPAKTKKIDINKFVKRAEEKKKETKVSAQKLFEAASETATTSVPKARKLNNQKLLPSSRITPTPQDEVDDFYGQDLDDLINEIRNDKEETQAVIDDLKKESEEQKKILNMLSPSFSTMEKNLEDILGATKEQSKLKDDEIKSANKESQVTYRKDREKELETKPKQETKKLEKKLEPVTGFLDMILNFLKNIALGGAITALMNIIENPAKMLNPIIEGVNSAINFVNGFLSTFVQPISDVATAMVNGLRGGLNLIEGAFNFVMKLFGTEEDQLLQNIPNENFESPKIEIPNIPLIEAPEQNQTETTGMKGGGVIPQQTTINNFTYEQGGKITNSSGEPVSGMGPDTRLIAAQPGEIVMSKSAVQYYGADNLLAMNKEGGGTNKPKTGKVMGYAGGGLLDFIGSGEGGYNSMNQGTQGGKIVGSTHNAKSKINKNLTEMTIGEVMERQTYLMDRNNPQVSDYGIFAAGKYQIIPKTMPIAVKAAGLSASDMFSPTNQEKLGRALIYNKRPAVGNFIQGKSNDIDAAMHALSNEFASMPDPTTGNSKYGAGNRALHTVQEVREVLLKERTMVASGGASMPEIASSTLAAQVSSPDASSKTMPPPPPAKKKTTAVIAAASGGSSAGSQSSSASNAGQTRVDGFSPIDLNNPELIVIKSIYNVVG